MNFLNWKTDTELQRLIRFSFRNTLNVLKEKLLGVNAAGQLNLTVPGEGEYIVPLATSADITYYVRSDGNDNNNGLANTAAGAFKTITKAIGVIPKVVNHKVIIYISAGTYSESVVVSGLITDNDFSIIGSGVVNIASLEVINCYGVINITGLTATTTTKDSFKASSSGRVVFTSCIASVTSTFSSFFAGSSNVFIDRCTISNRSVGVSSLAESIMYIGGCNGTNNGIACLSGYGSYLGYSGSMHSGSMVAQDGSILIPSSGVLNPWGDNTTFGRPTVWASLTADVAITGAQWSYLFFNNAYTNYLNGLNTSTGDFTAPQSGYYRIRAQVLALNVPPSKQVQIRILQNASASRITDIRYGHPSTAVHLLLGGDLMLYLGAGDKIAVQVYADSSVTITANSEMTRYEIVRVS